MDETHREGAGHTAIGGDWKRWKRPCDPATDLPGERGSLRLSPLELCWKRKLPTKSYWSSPRRSPAYQPGLSVVTKQEIPFGSRKAYTNKNIQSWASSNKTDTLETASFLQRFHFFLSTHSTVTNQARDTYVPQHKQSSTQNKRGHSGQDHCSNSDSGMPQGAQLTLCFQSTSSPHILAPLGYSSVLVNHNIVYFEDTAHSKLSVVCQAASGPQT
ncbi:hypothetical protein RRG08_059466 [Elysia crispata]|uniref:Uncharacterized protein n=1 Tax=Elysia crispata TaxID=231223 RepID=A0AAE1A5V8_9GAST|nr:hypothetical protein RRG08_059466 [Elysia crispata]